MRSQGQPAPTAYRRVGNYAVFVFDEPSAEAANALIDQVKYQQVVQWLGEDPFSYERATREFTETTLGVLVAVVKTSGLALVGCPDRWWILWRAPLCPPASAAARG